MERNVNPVLEACIDGDAQKLSELLAEGSEDMFQDFLRSSPMPAAAEGGHLQCVKLLLEAAERFNLSANEVIAKLCHLIFSSRTPLSIAAEKGNYEIVKLLATLFSKSTTKPDSGWALNKACDKGNMECFHIILKYVPWLIDARERGHTPIEHAASFGSLQSMKLIIEAGADIKNVSWALYLACRKGNYGKVELLLDSGCPVKSCGNNAPLSAAASSDATENSKLVELLLSRGADPCELTKYDIDKLYAGVKVTPLALAARHHNLEIVKILASHTPRSFGPIATFLAAFKNSHECLQYLFEEGFDTFTSTYFGYSQEDLWDALWWDHDEPNRKISKTLKLLLENGTKYNELTSDFCAIVFSDMDLEALDLFCTYGLLEIQFDCQNLPRLTEFLNAISLTHLEDEPDEFVKVNADFISRMRLATKHYPFAKFFSNDDCSSANLFDFHTSMFRPVVPTLVQICSWNIRCSIIRNQERLSSTIVKTLKLPPRLEKIIFNPS